MVQLKTALRKADIFFFSLFFPSSYSLFFSLSIN
eukprot:XP_001710067.1 Hypothetical protein GL50803_9969 [Giardia lamblia ATCC 50803]